MYADDFSGPVGPYIAKTGVYEFMIEMEHGRKYLIQANWRGRSTTDSFYEYGINYTHNQYSTPVAPTVGSSPLGSSHVQESPSSVISSTNQFWVFEPAFSGYARFLFWIAPRNSSHQVDARNFKFLVTDIGQSSYNWGQPSLGGASGTTPSEDPPVQQYTKEYYLDNHQVWTQFGKGDSYAPHWIRHGSAGGINSIYRTYMTLPSDALTTLSNADSVQNIQLRLSQTSGFSGAPFLSSINTSNISGSSEPTQYNKVPSSTSFNVGDTKWVSLPSEIRSALASGHRGIGVGRDVAVTLQDFYGTSASASYRPKIRITYTA